MYQDDTLPPSLEERFAALAATLEAIPAVERAALALRLGARLVELAAYAQATEGEPGDAPALILLAARLNGLAGAGGLDPRGRD